jgi:hypothetical protein
MDRITYKTNAERILFCQKKGIVWSQHCCLDMAWFISEPIEWESQGANPVIIWISSWNEYRIEISRDGNSAVLIYYCPWCGAKLPKSRHNLWLETLYKLGFNDPGEQNIPKEFESDEWWRKL